MTVATHYAVNVANAKSDITATELLQLLATTSLLRNITISQSVYDGLPTAVQRHFKATG